MIILFVYIIPYLTVSTIVMVIAVKYTNKIWIRGIVVAALFLVPTYDIIITNILGAYYCATAPKAFIKETVEYPESIYFEDNKQPFTKEDMERVKRNYLDGIHLKTLALNLSDGNVIIFSFDENSSEFKEYLKIMKEYNEAKASYKALQEELHKRLGSGEIKYKSDEHSKYTSNISAQEKLMFKLSSESSNIRNKIITQKINQKNDMPKINYTVIDNEIKLNKFVANFLYSSENIIIKNDTKEVIGHKISCMKLFYNIFPDSVGERYFSAKICGEDGALYEKIFDVNKWRLWNVSDHEISLNQFLYRKYAKEGEQK